MKFLKNAKVFAYIFYVLAVLYCLYTIFTIFSTVAYISSITSSGMYVTITFSDILQAFMSTVGPNVVYTALLFGVGYLIQLSAGEVVPEKSNNEFSYKSEEATSPWPTPSTTETTTSTADETTEELPNTSGLSLDENKPAEEDLVDLTEVNSPDETTEIFSNEETKEVNREVGRLEQAVADTLDEVEVEQVELDNEDE